jgi:hypothetical protein
MACSIRIRIDEIARLVTVSGGVSSPPPRCFLRLDAGDPVEDKTLEAHILVAATAVWQGIARELSPAFIMRLPFRRGTQAADVTGLIAHEEVLERMAFLLAAVVVLLVLGIGGAVDRSRRAIMPNRGVGDLPSVACVANLTAHAAAVRAGSRSWSAKA